MYCDNNRNNLVTPPQLSQLLSRQPGQDLPHQSNRGSSHRNSLHGVGRLVLLGAGCTSTQIRTCSNPTPYNYKTCEGDTTLPKSCSGGQCNPSSGSTSGEIKKCGSSKPDKMISSSNTITVKFHGNTSVTMKGFKETWKQVSATARGIIKTPPTRTRWAEVVTWLSLNYWQTWTLEIQSGKKVQITFESLDLEPNNSCGYDYVQISNKMYCGSTKPGPITSNNYKMTVTFHSDYSVNHKRFSAAWKAVDWLEFSCPAINCYHLLPLLMLNVDCLNGNNWQVS